MEKKRGRYFHSLREYENAGGNASGIRNAPCIHISGSVRGMRKQFWGYACDVVRVGNWVFKAN